MKKLLIILFLLIAIPAGATELITYKPQPFYVTAINKIKECKFNISCYFEKRLGTTITNLNSTDTMRNFPTLYNANNLAFNITKMEVGTSSVDSIVTLNNLTTAGSLATVGTITSGSWNASVIPVNKNGTGTTSPTLYQVMLGNGTSGLTVASGTGSSGQFLTSNGAGAFPTWQSSTVNQSADYTWLGTHDFTSATTTGVNIVNSYTASTSITSLKAVYIATTTGAIELSNASYTASSTYYMFHGFTLTGAALGNPVFVQTAGIVDGFTGLTTGAEYYVGNTAGTISTTMGNVPIMIGQAVSTTQLLINRQKRFGAREANTSNTSFLEKTFTDGQVNFSFVNSGGTPQCLIDVGGTNIASGTRIMTIDAPVNAKRGNATFFVKSGSTYSITCGDTTAFQRYWQPYN